MKFNYSYLNYEFIDDKERRSSVFVEIFNQKAEKELDKLKILFPELLRSRVTKIFYFLSTEDSVSVSRQGHKVSIPPFWAAFNIEVPKSYKTQHLIKTLDEFYPLIEYAHRNFETIPQNVPDDSLYYRQEALFDPLGLADINVEQAWDIETGKKFIKVGVHDNGVDSLHPDLDVLTGGDYYPNNQAPDWGVEDAGQPHGTQVAGIIGAKRNNQIGMAGIAGGDGSDTTGCSILDFKSPFLSTPHVSYRLAGIVDAARSAGTYFDYGNNYHDNNSTNDYYFNIAKGFGIHIGNHSYTIRTTLPQSEQPKDVGSDSTSVIDVASCNLCREAFLFSLQNGVINVVARGNSGILNDTYNQPNSVDGFYPQNLPDGWILSVGASGYDGNTIESGINQSPSEQSSDFFSLYGGNMDLVAPGSDSIVYSTLTTHIPGLYRKFNGTSAAAPHVAGTAALLLSHYNRQCYSNQNLTIEDVEYLLEESATDIFETGFDEKSGAGRLNAGAALGMIGDPTKQIIHPDSLISSAIVQRDTIALAYNKAFVADGWGPISQTIPLEQGKEYKVVRAFVENTYSFADYFTSSTTIIDSWACPSISNSVEFYRDTIKTQVPVGNTGQTTEGYHFQLFDRDPFDSIVNIDTINREIIVGGYFYKFLMNYSDIALNYSGSIGWTADQVVEDPLSFINVWYPFDPIAQAPRMVTSLYISDTTLTAQYTFSCDSLNILYDDTTITNPLSTTESELNDFTVELYPNPGNKEFTLDFSDSELVNQIFIYSSEGRKITQIPTQGSNLNVNVSSWTKGVYYIKVKGDSFSKTLKYLKQ
ncbi:MAG TPA: S8 family peptidase [Fermentimonas sp.]|nr:S8 family peptidase [Fermentimonas sp.]